MKRDMIYIMSQGRGRTGPPGVLETIGNGQKRVSDGLKNAMFAGGVQMLFHPESVEIPGIFLGHT